MKIKKIKILKNIFLIFLCLFYLLYLNINDISNDNDHQTNHLFEMKVEENNRSYNDIFCYNNSANYLNSDISSYMKKGDYRSLYRSAMDYAINKISTVEKRESIVNCSFPGFDREESNEIWKLAGRRMEIKHKCNKYENFFESEIYAKHFYWDRRLNFGYCSHLKAGTTTWMSRMLDWHGVDSSLLDTQEIHEEIDKMYPPLTEENIKDIRSEDPLIFSFVRHPFTRLVSTYLTKIKKPDYNYAPLIKKWITDVRGKSLVTIVDEIKENIIENDDIEETIIDNLLHIDKIRSKEENHIVLQTNSTDEFLNFREFVLVTVKQILECFHDVECLLEIDPHWQPQYVRCSPCQIEVDVPGQLESFQTDNNILLKIMKRNNDASIVNRRLNAELNGRFKKGLRIFFNYIDTLNDDEFQLLAVAYTIDIDLFGYEIRSYFNDINYKHLNISH